MERSNWEKYGIFVSIISLVIGVIGTTSTAYVAIQANNLAQKSLDLQNYTPIITVNLDLTHRLFQDGGYFANGTTIPVTSYGNLNCGLTVISPHYGEVNITIANFTVFDVGGVLNQEKRNLTTVTFPDFYTLENNEQSVFAGVNQLSFVMPLQASYYPNATMIPQNSNSSNPFLAQIGILYFKVMLFDAQPKLHLSKTETFSASIMVSIKNS